jgi:Tfp pilus assembly protein PilX
MKSLRSDESGIISIAVTLIVSGLLTLLALGFASLANREYRQSLDQQLNTQAFYAAESGINDVISGNVTSEDCDNTPTQLGTDSSTSVTCLDFNNTPSSLEFSEVGTDSSKVVPIESATPIRSVTISWEQRDGSGTFSEFCDRKLLPASGANSWGDRTPLLTAMLMPKNFSNPTDLSNNTQKMILYPTGASCGATGDIAAEANSFSSQGKFADANCSSTNTPRLCKVRITNVNAIGNSYVLRFRSIYNTSSVTVTAQDASGNNVALIGAQREIDSTGRASDVLRRLKVNVPISDYADKIFPEFAVESSDGVCKRMLVSPGSNPSALIDPSYVSNPDCNYP